MNPQILENIRDLKRRLLPNDKVILFGSQARGDARPDSDWDLLVLLDKEKISCEDEDKIFPLVMMGWKYGTYISIKMYSKVEWEKRHFTPFYKNIEKDGIEII